MEDNWAAKAASKLRQQDQQNAQNDAVTLEKRKLIEEQGPALWMAVREHVRKLCGELNTDYGQHVVIVQDGPIRELNVQFRHAGRMNTLNAECDMTTAPNALKWSYSSSPVKTSYSLYPNNGVVIFQNSMVPSTPVSIARQMLDGLIAQ
jgi:hypothetical protein